MSLLEKLGSEPECLRGIRVLVLAPHPDDEVFGCGGTMMLLAAAGARLTCVVLTDGAGRSVDPEDTVRIREAESCAAAAVLNVASPKFWRLPDGKLGDQLELKSRLHEFIDRTGCELLLLPSAFERHPDHYALSVLATTVARNLEAPIELAFYEVGEPLAFTTLVDISTVLSRKIDAMRCFQSELRFQPYDKQIEGLNRYRSYTATSPSAQAAEAFLVIQADRIEADMPIFSPDPKLRWPMAQLDMSYRQASRALREETERSRLLKEQTDKQIALQIEQYQQICSKLAELMLQHDEAVRSREEALRSCDEAIRVRDWMRNSKSWRLTEPLRSANMIANKARASFFRLLLKIALGVYRLPLFSGLNAHLPIRLKRYFRDTLVRGASVSQDIKPAPGLPDNPLVSLIIPVYNHARYLRGAIESALAQSHQRLEVIVVDDASTDPEVAAILASLETRERLSILRNESNLGISRTQNRALLASKGDIIGFLDCDDELSNDAVERCLEHWREDTVYSHSARINIDDDGEEINRISFEHLPRLNYFEENLAAMYATHFKMIRRDVFAKVGLFDVRHDAAQDYDMLMRVAFHYPSSGFVFIPRFVYRHRLHQGQTTERYRPKQAQAAKDVQAESRLRREIRDGKFDRFLSIIMLSFGKQSQTLKAIESIEETVRVPHEIILFDNGSDPEVIEFIQRNIEGKFDNVRVFYSDCNLGPAAGRKAALTHAKGDWFIIFDNDEIAEPGWLEELLVVACSDSRIGSVTCKVIFPNRELQCCGGYMVSDGDDVVRLELHGRGQDAYNLATAAFLDCDWCPIGATLFTINPSPYLHDGYPNVFEDVGVSMSLRRAGYRLVNSPASWVWHEHVTFQKNVEMGERYTSERYDPKRMLLSVASFYEENDLVIFDDYVWRENRLSRDELPAVKKRLEETLTQFRSKRN